MLKRKIESGSSELIIKLKNRINLPDKQPPIFIVKYHLFILFNQVKII